MGEFARKIRPKIAPSVAKEVRLVTLDIETSPATVHAFGLFKQNIGINQVLEPGRVLGVGYKFYDDGKPTFLSEHELGHAAMIEAAHKVLSDADLVISWNGIGFDIPHLQKEFLKAGLTPPKPFRQIDLLRTARKQFRFESNKLDYVAQQLGVGAKVQHTGHSLWRSCLEGDPKAWKLMDKYCRGDVVLTEKLFDKLRPWIPNMPHLSMWMGSEWGCPSCGHKDLSKHNEGTAYAYVQRYRLYHCPSCGTWVRGNKRLQDPTHTRQARIN